MPDPRLQPDADAAEAREVQTLLDEISAGTIEDASALDESQLALLRSHLGDEELEAVLDRLRGPGEDA